MMRNALPPGNAVLNALDSRRQALEGVSLGAVFIFAEGVCL